MIYATFDRIGPPTIRILGAKHEPGFIFGQLGSARVRHGHRVLAFLRDRREFRSLRKDDRGHGVARFHFDGPPVDASVKGATFSKRVRIGAVRLADAIRDGTAVGSPDVVGRRCAVIARRFRFESTFASDQMEFAALAQFGVEILRVFADAVEFPAGNAFDVLLTTGSVDVTMRAGRRTNAGETLRRGRRRLRLFRRSDVIVVIVVVIVPSIAVAPIVVVIGIPHAVVPSIGVPTTIVVPHRGNGIRPLRRRRRRHSFRRRRRSNRPPSNGVHSSSSSSSYRGGGTIAGFDVALPIASGDVRTPRRPRRTTLDEISIPETIMELLAVGRVRVISVLFPATRKRRTDAFRRHRARDAVGNASHRRVRNRTVFRNSLAFGSFRSRRIVVADSVVSVVAFSRQRRDPITGLFVIVRRRRHSQSISPLTAGRRNEQEEED